MNEQKKLLKILLQKFLKYMTTDFLWKLQKTSMYAKVEQDHL